jgi:hypothetical protein
VCSSDLFPVNSFKTLGYKFLYNDRYECRLEGNRDAWLNDAVYDTVGGVKGPLVMPLAYFDRCSAIGHAVEVIFKLNCRANPPGVTDTIAVNGDANNKLPHVVSWDIPSINPMRDDGVYPDDVAHDKIYARSIVFPDSSNRYVEYKYIINRTYECGIGGNRNFYVDDAYDAVGHPQRLWVSYYDICATDVPAMIPKASPLDLGQNYPNPFNPTTTITFTAPSQGRVVLRIYDVQGKLVKTVLDEVVQAGPVTARWDGTDVGGRKMSTGVYFYEVRIGSERASRKMVLLK